MEYFFSTFVNVSWDLGEREIWPSKQFFVPKCTTKYNFFQSKIKISKFVGSKRNCFFFFSWISFFPIWHFVGADPPPIPQKETNVIFLMCPSGKAEKFCFNLASSAQITISVINFLFYIFQGFYDLKNVTILVHIRFLGLLDFLSVFQVLTSSPILFFFIFVELWTLIIGFWASRVLGLSFWVSNYPTKSLIISLYLLKYMCQQNWYYSQAFTNIFLCLMHIA